MSLEPIQEIINCNKCGHAWVIQKNTLDPKTSTCPKCQQIHWGSLFPQQNEFAIDKYKCWDCEKEIENVDLPKEISDKCPRDLEGYKYIICTECGLLEDEQTK